jgi:hypothetical protein
MNWGWVPGQINTIRPTLMKLQVYLTTSFMQFCQTIYQEGGNDSPEAGLQHRQSIQGEQAIEDQWVD